MIAYEKLNVGMITNEKYKRYKEFGYVLESSCILSRMSFPPFCPPWLFASRIGKLSTMRNAHMAQKKSVKKAFKCADLLDIDNKGTTTSDPNTARG